MTLERATFYRLVLVTFCPLPANALYADSCSSGLLPGQRPGPYSAVISTGPQRGQSFCYICETAERPAAVVFARSLSEPLAKLVQGLDKAIDENKKSDLRAWVTFLSADQLGLDPKIVAWSRKHGIRNIPAGVFEDVTGPPSYRLARDADVTVLFFVKQKVVASFAYRSGEWNDNEVSEIMKALPRIAGPNR
jgi:hypothetical protein